MSDRSIVTMRLPDATFRQFVETFGCREGLSRGETIRRLASLAANGMSVGDYHTVDARGMGTPQGFYAAFKELRQVPVGAVSG